MSVKRILWLCNNFNLMNIEVPMLREIGFEVYVPKKPPFGFNVNVDWSLDKEISIPNNEINILNSTNFYDGRISADSMNVVNHYFDIAIFGIYIEPLKSLVMKFEGILVLHSFGTKNGLTYTQIIQENAGIWLLKEIEKLGSRFWFGQAFETINSMECDFFKKRSVYLPFAIKNDKINDNWSGSTKKILFICPEIKTDSTNFNTYKKFKTAFNGIPYSIGGTQPIMIENDRTILGCLGQDDFENLFSTYSALFYYTQDMQNIPHYLFEAIKYGIPVIYMAGGLLDTIGGCELPGRCKTQEEARKKCLRLVRGDSKFANLIRRSQLKLLDKVAYDYCRVKWISAMNQIQDQYNAYSVYITPKKVKKLGIILPGEYTGGVLDYTIRLIIAIKRGAFNKNEDIDLVFGRLDHTNYDMIDSFSRLEELDIPIRKFNWEVINKKRVDEANKILGYPIQGLSEMYCVPNDGIRYFEDCDFLLFTADRVSERLYITQPYGVIVHDYIQRYLPSLFGERYEDSFIQMVRGAEALFSTTNITRQDCIQYAGADATKIHLIPLFFDEIKRSQIKSKSENPYFVWSTNLTPHKNHKVALKALSEYYSNGGRLECYITGTNTNWLKEDSKEISYDYVNEIRDIMNSDKYLKDNIKLCGNLPKELYINVLQNALFFLHPGYADNGNGTAFDAAMLGVPTVSSRYPAMENLNNVMNLGFTFFDRKKPTELKNILFDIEEDPKKFKKLVPPKDLLMKFTIEDDNVCNKIYDTIKTNLLI